MAKRKTQVKDPGSWDDVDLEAEPIDVDNIEALIEATKPRIREYAVGLRGGGSFLARFYVQGQAASMEAMSGHKRIKEGDAIKTKRERDIYIDRINPQAINFQLFDDPLERYGVHKDGDMTMIPVQALSIVGWLDLQEAVFPGTHDRNEDVSARVNTARGGSRRNVSGQDADPSVV